MSSGGAVAGEGRPWELSVTVCGWLLRIDRYGLAVHDRWGHDRDVDAATHDCARDHPDAVCDLDGDGAFYGDDIEDLLWRARGGDDPTVLIAEFYAGIRADPERPS